MAVRNGTNGSETLTGTAEGDTINGFGGNDTLIGAEGNDTMNGGTGSDSMTGGTGSDVFVYDIRGFGNDVITDFFQGQDRIDLSTLGFGDFSQLQPFLTQVGTGSRLTLRFGFSDESITINNILPAQLTAADFIFNSSTTGFTFNGTTDSEVLIGSLGSDTINGGSGDDTIVAGAGNDTIIGGSGADNLRGGAGFDLFVYDFREFGNDTIMDFTQGQDRIDLSQLGFGDFSQLQPFITQNGSGSRLTLRFGFSDESITINNILPSQLSAADFVFNSSVTGFTFNGTSDSEILIGSLGPDTIKSGSGNDTIVAGAGNDTIIGGTGADNLRGGAGFDLFVYDFREFGNDTLADFMQGQDRIDLSQLGVGDFSQLLPFITQVGTGSRLTLRFGFSDESITINNILPSQLTAADFIFQSSTSGFIFNGTSDSEVLFGSLGPDTINAGSGNDTVVAGAGNDTINGGSGNDIIDGGLGIDTAVLGGLLSQISGSRQADGSILITSADGTDRLSNIEYVQVGGIPYLVSRYSDAGVPRVANFTVGAGGWATQDQFPRAMADVNGDGYADIVGFGQAGTLVSFGSSAGSFGDPVLAVSNFGVNQGWSSNNIFHRELADVNGDGRDDIVGFGTAGVLVSLAQPNGTFGNATLASSNFNPANGWSSQDGFTRTLADVNGDGVADIVGFGVPGTFVALGTGAGSFGATNFAIGNFGAAQGWTSDNMFHREVGDVNGDGRADIVGFGTAGTLVALGQANGTFASPILALGNFGVNQGWSSQDMFTRDLADVNGDGRDDIVGFGVSGTFVSYGQVNGTFSTAVFDLANFGRNQGWSSDNIFHRELADVNGDGRADIVGFGFSGVFAAIAFDGQVI